MSHLVFCKVHGFGFGFGEGWNNNLEEFVLQPYPIFENRL